VSVSSLRQILTHDEAPQPAQRAYPSPRILSRYIRAPFMTVYFGRFIEKFPHHERDAPQDRLPLSARASRVAVASCVERLHPRVVR
jgi:hypothetical protein